MSIEDRCHRYPAKLRAGWVSRWMAVEHHTGAGNTNRHVSAGVIWRTTAQEAWEDAQLMRMGNPMLYELHLKDGGDQ